MEYIYDSIEENIDDPKWLSKIIKLCNNHMTCINQNTDNLIEAINKNSKSSAFLAWIWFFIWTVWLIATIIFWILPLIK